MAKRSRGAARSGAGAAAAAKNEELTGDTPSDGAGEWTSHPNAGAADAASDPDEMPGVTDVADEPDEDDPPLDEESEQLEEEEPEEKPDDALESPDAPELHADPPARRRRRGGREPGRDLPAAPEVPAPRAVRTAPGVHADAIKLKWDRAKEAPRAKTREYWLGQTKKSPFSSLVVAGIWVPRMSKEIHLDKDGEVAPNSTHVLGIRVRLTDDMLTEFKAEVLNQRARRIGNVCTVINADNPIWNPLPGTDVPVGAYIYCVEVKDVMPTNWLQREPPPMVDVNDMD